MWVAHLAAAKPKPVIVLSGFNDGFARLVSIGALPSELIFSRGFRVGHSQAVTAAIAKGRDD